MIRKTYLPFIPRSIPYATLFMLIVFLLLCVLSGSVSAQPGKGTQQAAAITVDSLADDLSSNGNCTLREAVKAATQNTAVDGCPAGSAEQTDVISFSVDGEIELMMGEMKADEDLIIQGNGRDKTIIDAEHQDRIFHFDGGEHFELSALTLQHGYVDDFNDVDGGGTIYNASAVLELDDVRIFESLTFGPYALGAAIYSEGPLKISNSLIKSNLSESGAAGIFASGTRVEIENSSILNNNVDLAGGGGGLLLVNSDVMISSSKIMNNSATNSSTGGGGLAVINSSQGKTVTISGTTISGNSVSSSATGGGGLYCLCDLTLVDSTIDGNKSSSEGGGGLAGEGKWAISGSTFSNNTAPLAYGGGIYLKEGQLSITNSTITGNRAGYGGGLYAAGETAVQHTTFFENEATGNEGGQALFIASESPGAVIGRSIIYGPVGKTACTQSGILTSTGYNILQDKSCGFVQGDDQVSGNPMLGPLKDNGGLTLTHALLSGSPAVDKTPCSAEIQVDQRGVSRPYGSKCDSGAYEFDGEVMNNVYLPQLVK